jgi:ethanolamine utilization protein EutN
MKLGKIIGSIVSTVKIQSFEGMKILLLQPLDENLKEAGLPIAALDTLSSGEGQIVYYETSKEAGRILVNTMNPCDAAVMGLVDEITLEVKNAPL